MSYSIEWHPEALSEARDAYERYANLAPHVLPRYSSALDAAVDWISTSPKACPPGKYGTRLYLMKSFPYVIHFRLTDDMVRIFAVSHTSREPTYWHSRLP